VPCKVCQPPTINTLPFASSVALALLRPVTMLPVFTKVFVAGSFSYGHADYNSNIQEYRVRCVR
jgi:hypothetical protein